MRYLGVARIEDGRVVMPDGAAELTEGQCFEAMEVGGDILLISPPLDRERLSHIERLANQSIDEHRKALEGLAR
jgi:hypothetical protein